MTTTLPERVSQSAFDGSRLRVVMLVDLHDGAQHRFLEAYERIRHHVAATPGHLSDQLCQSFENPSQWLITSEWESAPQFLDWVNSEQHIEQIRPLSACIRTTSSMRFNVLRETGEKVTGGAVQQAPRLGDDLVRHALTFTVRPGSEEAVAKLLADYDPPSAKVDDTTRLCRTTLFMHGNRVVRTVEVKGDLTKALRYVARQPEVRAVEEAINPYLEVDRDLDDPESARVFFTRAALPAVHVMATDPAAAHDPGGTGRHAVHYRAKPGMGTALARYLARQDEATAAMGGSPVVRSTIFQRDDLVVRLVDVHGPPDAAPGPVLGLHGPHEAAVLDRLLDPDARDARDGSAAPAHPGPERPADLLARSLMRLVTDRHAQDS
ncbi:SchA/CurD-like domain-containing protein [Streptomyces sp. NPDC012888]|uniref:SchA/CurD-like domain-containing protein n=1 Tax=Streptomyces sp. NPDC012888 TaxID=3364855 RepID=UPI00367ECA3A